MKTLYADIVIVGGGSAGVAAASAAAKSGQSVYLIERLDYLGGKATAAEVGTICGLYKFSKNTPSQYIVKGFARDFAEELKQRSNADPLHNINGLHYLPYQIEDYKQQCIDLLKKNEVEILFKTEVISATNDNGHIQSIIVKSEEKEISILFKAIVDCSGDSVISQLTELPVIKSETYQAAAQIFTLEGIYESDEAKLGMIMMREIQKGISSGMLESFCDRLSIVQGSIKNNRVSFKLGIPVPVTHQKNNLQELRIKSQEIIEGLVKFLKQHANAFKTAQLHHIADEVGIRVGIRPQGKYVLNGEDVLHSRKFDHAIANASWPIESWGLDKRVNMKYFELENYYQIPAECLVSLTCDNLFFAGRNISADDEAIASARVMGICFQTGYAAGKLAEGHIRKEPFVTTVKSIQQEQIF